MNRDRWIDGQKGIDQQIYGDRGESIITPSVLFTVCGGCSFGGLGWCSCRVFCMCRGCCSLSVCVCVCV